MTFGPECVRHNAALPDECHEKYRPGCKCTLQGSQQVYSLSANLGFEKIIHTSKCFLMQASANSSDWLEEDLLVSLIRNRILHLVRLIVSWLSCSGSATA